MIDLLGQEVKIGDYVTFNSSGKGLTFGMVEKITPKKVKVLFLNHWSHLTTVGTLTKDHHAVVKATCDTVEFQAAKNKLCHALMKQVARSLTD